MTPKQKAERITALAKEYREACGEYASAATLETRMLWETVGRLQSLAEGSPLRPKSHKILAVELLDSLLEIAESSQEKVTV